MTLVEIAEIVSRRVGAPVDLTWGFFQEATKVIIETLENGGEVKIRGVGTLKWVPVPGRKLYDPYHEQHTQVEPGLKLKFAPAKNFKKRRSSDVERRRDDKTGSGTR